MTGTDLVALSLDLESRLGVPPLIRLGTSKAAIDKGWPRGPYEDPDSWRAKLTNHTGNVATVMGCRPDRTGVGLLVLDADTYKVEGTQSLVLAEQLGWLEAPTLTDYTARGGLHFFFRYDPLRWVARSRDLRGKTVAGTGVTFPGGMEVKAEAGYARLYGEWHDDTEPDLANVADAPEQLLRLIGYPIDPESGEVPTHVGPWAEFDPDKVDPATAEAVQLLMQHFGGHHPIIVSNGNQPSVEITRPGKDQGEGRSATIGWAKPGLVKVFTDGWEPFDQGDVIDLGQLRRKAGVVTTPEITVQSLKLPDGYRAWTPADGQVPPPTLAPAAFHGPLGEYLQLVEGETEAHPAAIGAHILAGVSTLAGRTPIYSAGSVTHPTNLFLAVVGPSSTGAKGVAQGDGNRLLRAVEPTFPAAYSLSGLGSGEMLVYEVRDPDPNDEDDRGGDPIRIIQNAELSQVFKVAAREGSILSDHLRLAFDGEPLRHSTRSHGIVSAARHHINVVGSITPAELVKLLDDTSRANGFGNRFLYLYSEMGTLLPFGGKVDDGAVQVIAHRVGTRLAELEQRAGRLGRVVYQLADDARDTWAAFYRRSRLGMGDGFVADMTARSVAHAIRIATLLAILDGADAVGADHIRAADAWVTYGAATVAKVFGTGATPVGNMLLAAIRDAGPDGLTLTEQSGVFSRNRTAEQLNADRQALEDARLIVTVRQGGSQHRPTHRSIAIWPDRGATNQRDNERRSAA